MNNAKQRTTDGRTLGEACRDAEPAALPPVRSEPLLACIPTNWLDPMLTGPERIIGDPPYNCRDIERVLLAVRYRIEAHLKANKSMSVGGTASGTP